MQNLNIAAEALQRARMLDAMTSDLADEGVGAVARAASRVMLHNAEAKVSCGDTQTDARVVDVSTFGMSLLTTDDLNLTIGDIITIEYSGSEFSLKVAWNSTTEHGYVFGGERARVPQTA